MIVVLGLLHLEVQVHPLVSPVFKDNAPLVELAAIVMQLVVAMDERPDIVSVTAGVVGEE